MIEDIITNVEDGEFDPWLERLAAVVLARRLALGHLKGMAMPPETGKIPSKIPNERFKTGDKVVFDGNISPKYLAGEVGTITKRQGRRWGVRVEPILVNGVKRKMSGKVVLCPPDLIKKVF